MRNYSIYFKLGFLFLIVAAAGVLGVRSAGALSPVGASPATLPESRDFATLVLHDAWDMNQYSDVSQYLNESGQRSVATNLAMANGQFTGQSVGNDSTGTNAYFFPLFPGYLTAMLIGKVGYRYPIDASTYHCLYIALSVNSARSGDSFRALWFADDNLTNGTWGYSAYQPLNGNTGASRYYDLYKIDLAAVNHAGTGWNQRATWQGLRIDPTIQADSTFAVDWVRLTSCAANNTTVSFVPDSNIHAIWLKDSVSNRWVRAAHGLTIGGQGRATLDLQGVPPGSYTVGVGTGTAVLQTSTSPLVIDPAPVVDFASPSFFSGPDYASQAGNPWDFSASDDVKSVHNLSYNLQGGLLNTTIPSGPSPAGVDAQMFLNLPQPIQPATYRYLSFRMETDWKAPWQNVPHGMIVRLVWGIQGVDNVPTTRCWLVSQDIPFDIGWQTYWIDLGDAFNGLPEATTVTDCPGSTPHWTNSPPILDLRFDPDENITVGNDNVTGGGPFHHQIDWIRLNAIDSVHAGTPYLIQLDVNRGLSQIAYYYTTDRGNPTQFPARPFRAAESVAVSHRIMLPLMLTPIINSDMAGLPSTNTTFLWDTSGVGRNTYYVCVRATGGGNTDTYCSEAPIVVN
jgi:hypothetical protein